MPELPEAENIVRSLAPHVEGRPIRRAEFFTERSRQGPIPELAGRRILSLSRYGKQILMQLDAGPGHAAKPGFLLIELRMTGLLLWRTETTPHTRARFDFPHGTVCFEDIRQFGSLRWLSDPPDHLGPDPLSISVSDLRRSLGQHERMIKPLLLDQHFLRGLGNIYVDEILFRARIHPVALASRVSRSRAARLHDAMQLTLGEAIESGGSSISDYVNADGQKGRFQLRHRVYAKEGKPCPRCRVPIRRILVAQRGTHYCPNCQRR